MKLENLKRTIKQLSEGGFLDWQKEVEENGGEIFLVGGAVRDALLGGKEIKDYDFVVRGVEIERLEKILAGLGRVELVGKNFGVYKFVPAGKKMKVAFDIALPRTEISLATGGYKDFKVRYDHKLKIEEDLGRRDFTINALAWNLKKEKLIDEFQGLRDLQEKKIRTVGNAYERFREDYSRMLRGIRFACQMNYEIEKTTWEALKKLMKNINDERGEERVVPYEIIGEEILKALVYNPVEAFDLMDKSGAFKELIPELEKMKGCPQPKNWHSEGDVWTHTRLCLQNLNSEAFRKRFKEPIIFSEKSKIQISNQIQNPKSKNIKVVLGAELVMAVLFHDVGKPATITTPEKDGADRIRFSGHDETGADLAESIFKKLKLSAAPDFDFDPERATWLIRRHHLFDTKPATEMKNPTLEKYFFGERYSGEDLLKLGFIDGSGSIPQNKKDYLSSFNLMVKRIEELKKLGKGRRLPKPLLDGNEVMEVLKIKPGKKVGRILEELREKQLAGKIKSKKEAEREVRRQESTRPHRYAKRCGREKAKNQENK
ncbi:CCA tRNA nucleotidyltransferase [Candidatus Kuenenbacteria bacterium]|nr:CCA tRNA nucleotidyltransferase [Candidatus Kuenenbacteria bacterium]